MTFQKGTGPGGQVVIEDDAAVGTPITDMDSDTGDVLASAAAWIDSHHVILDTMPALGTGVATWMATPTSTNLKAAVTGETGSGALVFGTDPTLVAPTITAGIFMAEQAAAPTEVAGYAHIWAQTATPNELWLTDDAGRHFPLVNSATRGEVIRITSAGLIVRYPSVDPDDPDKNGTVLSTAATAVANGDTVIIGPGSYSQTEVLFAADDLTITFNAQLIQRPSGTNSLYVLRFDGDDIRVNLRGCVIDNNRAANLSAYVTSVNENRGITAGGSRHMYDGGVVKNIGPTGNAFQSDNNFGEGLVVRGMRAVYGGLSSFRVRAESWWLIDSVSIDPDEGDLIHTDIADEAARLALVDVSQFETVRQLDNTFWMLTGADPSDSGDWTEKTISMRHFEADAGAVVCKSANIIRGTWEGEYISHANPTFGNTVDALTLLVDGLRMVGNDSLPLTTAMMKIDDVKNVMIRNCVFEAVGNYALSLWHGAGAGLSEFTIENCYFDGTLQGNTYAKRISIINSQIGMADAADLEDGFSNLSAETFELIDSRLGGGSIYGIDWLTTNGTDVVDIRNSLIETNSASATYAFRDCAPEHVVVYNSEKNNVGAGAIYWGPTSSQRLRMTSLGTDPETYLWSSDLGTPGEAGASDVHPTPNQDPPFGSTLTGVDGQRIINVEGNDDTFWQNQWLWDETRQEWSFDGIVHNFKFTSTGSIEETAFSIKTVDDRAYVVAITAVAANTAIAAVAMYSIMGLFKNVSGTLTAIGTPAYQDVVTPEEESAGWACILDVSSPNIRIRTDAALDATWSFEVRVMSTG